MIVETWDHEGRSTIMKISDQKELEEFFHTFPDREPFYCEFVKSDYKLSVCVRRDLGSVQHSPANGDPPYMVAITTAPHDPNDEVEFFIGSELTLLSARHAVPLDTAKEIIRYFLETGQRSPVVPWENI